VIDQLNESTLRATAALSSALSNVSGLGRLDLVKHQLDRLVQILASEDMRHRELEKSLVPHDQPRLPRPHRGRDQHPAGPGHVFLCMEMAGISLQRISLGALIIALGLLVDDTLPPGASIEDGGTVEKSAQSNVARLAVMPLMVMLISPC
jgi:hypothetical protein